MKRLKLIILFFSCAFSSFGDRLDSLTLIDGTVNLASVIEVSPNLIKYVFPNERAVHSIHRNAIQKIIFESGRTLHLNNLDNQVKSFEDWKSVEISNDPAQIQGLEEIGVANIKARGLSSFSSVTQLQNRLIDKIRITAAMHGAEIAYILNLDTEQNGFLTSPGSTGLVTLYSYPESRVAVEEGEYMITEIKRLRKNSIALEHVPFFLTKYQMRAEDISQKTDGDWVSLGDRPLKGNNKLSGAECKAVSFDEKTKKLVLLWEDRNKRSVTYYNIVLVRQF